MCYYLNWNKYIWDSLPQCVWLLVSLYHQVLLFFESETSDLRKQHSPVSGGKPHSKSPTRHDHRSNWLTVRYVPVQDYIWCMSSVLEHAVLLADTSDRIDGALYVWHCIFCYSVTLILVFSCTWCYKMQLVFIIQSWVLGLLDLSYSELCVLPKN